VKTKDMAVLVSRKSEMDARLDPRWQPQSIRPEIGRANVT
jgi:hypothetical protein